MSTASARLTAIAASAALTVAASGLATNAFAAEGQNLSARSASAAVERATSTAGLVLGAPQGVSALVTSAGARVDIPKQATGTVSVTAADGTSVGIGLPTAGASQDASISQAGTVTFAGTRDKASAVQPLTDGVRVLAVTTAKGQQEFRFPLSLPSGTTMIPRPDGGFDLAQKTNNGPLIVKGSIDAPWAKDAAGKAVATRYKLDGNTLTQVIEPNSQTTGSIVADPKITWGIITGTAYLNKQETIQAMSYTGLAGIVTTYLPPPFNVVATLDVGTIVANATMASSNNECIKLKLQMPLVVSGIYSGGYCT